MIAIRLVQTNNEVPIYGHKTLAQRISKIITQAPEKNAIASGL
jgi:hypothetical protein